MRLRTALILMSYNKVCPGPLTFMWELKRARLRQALRVLPWPSPPPPEEAPAGSQRDERGCSFLWSSLQAEPETRRCCKKKLSTQLSETLQHPGLGAFSEAEEEADPSNRWHGVGHAESEEIPTREPCHHGHPERIQADDQHHLC